jgi:hypothetical protein
LPRKLPVQRGHFTDCYSGAFQGGSQVCADAQQRVPTAFDPVGTTCRSSGCLRKLSGERGFCNGFIVTLH